MKPQEEHVAAPSAQRRDAVQALRHEEHEAPRNKGGALHGLRRLGAVQHAPLIQREQPRAVQAVAVSVRRIGPSRRRRPLRMLARRPSPSGKVGRVEAAPTFQKLARFVQSNLSPPLTRLIRIIPYAR